MTELPEVGAEFAGYRLESVIGRGAMSVVYAADHPRFGNGIALKVLAAEVAADDIFRRRFLDESRIAASMDHPNVIPIYDVGESDGLLYLAMRRVSGGDLRRTIAAGGPLPPLTAVALLSQATRALDAAHRLGLVHRDVKPENLLIDTGDEAGSAHLYLADFGISRLGMERNGLTSTGQFLGTTDYVAPEQLTEPYVYGSADQYSLGCVLYECLTGRVPFAQGLGQASTRPALRDDLPSALRAMFDRVLAERPGDRYNTCREFLEAASVALADMAIAPSSAVDSPESEPAPARAASQSAPEPVSYPAAATPGDDQPELASAAAVDQPGDAPSPAEYQREVPAEPVEYQRQVPPEPVEHQPESAPPTPSPSPSPTPAAGPAARDGRRRTRWLVIAAVLLLICAGGGGAYAALSSQPKANASTATPVTPVTPKPMPQRAPVSLLTQVLTAADASHVAMGMLPPSSCTQRSAAKVVCAAPWSSISRATFTTYPTLSALYAAYKAEVRSLNHGRYRQNVQDCGLSAPSPYGEIAWNHREQHSRAYTAAEMISGKVSVVTAMGRMACIATGHHSEDVVWTTDYGRMLGVAIGQGSHTGVWFWWIAVHHNIIFPGTPMDMGDKSVSLMSGAPMPTSSASASASMAATTAPSTAASTAPSMAATPSPSMAASPSSSMAKSAG